MLTLTICESDSPEILGTLSHQEQGLPSQWAPYQRNLTNSTLSTLFHMSSVSWHLLMSLYKLLVVGSHDLQGNHLVFQMNSDAKCSKRTILRCRHFSVFTSFLKVLRSASCFFFCCLRYWKQMCLVPLFEIFGAT